MRRLLVASSVADPGMRTFVVSARIDRTSAIHDGTRGQSLADANDAAVRWYSQAGDAATVGRRLGPDRSPGRRSESSPAVIPRRQRDDAPPGRKQGMPTLGRLSCDLQRHYSLQPSRCFSLPPCRRVQPHTRQHSALPIPVLQQETYIIDFNQLPQFDISGSYGFATGSHDGLTAPAGDDTPYLYTSTSIGDGVATLQTPDFSTVSFYWGSIEAFNKVELLESGRVLLTVTGADILPANSNQDASFTNQRIYFTAGPDETITGLRFTSTGVAYEVDDVSGQLANPPDPLPEPVTWGLMIVGFSTVGVAARLRRACAHCVSA